MKTIISMVASMIRSAFRFVWAVCKRTGQLVMQMSPDLGSGPGRSVPQTPTPRQSTAAKAQNDPGLSARVKELATTLAIGDDPEPAAFKSVPPRVGDWLLAMDRVMLCRIIGARDGDLKSHLMGNGSLRGVIACDEGAIREYVEAMSRPEPEPNCLALRRTMQPTFV